VKWLERTARALALGLRPPKKPALKGRPNRLAYNPIICCFIDAAQSLSHLIIHTVFSTKDRQRLLQSEEIRTEIYAYIGSQAEHLRKITFQDELRQLLKRHRVVFVERYLWD
jgi:hypothetical protein